MALQRQFVLPTLNYLADPELTGADFVTAGRPHAHEFVLSNSFGFGGTNCCVIFRGV
jgi:3-oxoacyl-[acyl-carrier-protein] synthase II